MQQIFDKTSNQKNNWRWDNPRAFGDQVNRCNPQTTTSGKVKDTGERFSWYGSNDLRARIEPPSCRQYKLGNFLAIGSVNWDEIIDGNDDDDNWADHGAPSGGWSLPGDGNDKDDGDGEKDMRGGDKGTGKGKGTKDGELKRKATEDGKGKGKGKGKGNCKGKDIVKQTPGGDDISRTIALQLQKEMSEADWDMEG